MNSLPLYIYRMHPQRRTQRDRQRLRRRGGAPGHGLLLVCHHQLPRPPEGDVPDDEVLVARIAPPVDIAPAKSQPAGSWGCWPLHGGGADPGRATGGCESGVMSRSTGPAPVGPTTPSTSWINDVTQQGLQVVFTPSGSAQGRQDFANGVTDFGVSDIGYQGEPRDRRRTTHRTDLTPTSRSSAAPRRSPTTSWSPDIRSRTCGCPGSPSPRSSPTRSPTGTTRRSPPTTTVMPASLDTDHPGRPLRGRRHDLPVHRLDSEHRVPLSSGSHSPGTTSRSSSGLRVRARRWPRTVLSGVMNFVVCGAGTGSIGFDEYSYPLPSAPLPGRGPRERGRLFHHAGRLRRRRVAHPGRDQLHAGSRTTCSRPSTNVYTYNDPRTYPLSSYSYEIEPTASCNGQPPCDPTMNTPKRQALADFDSYSLCQGQSQMAPIGYSPLPINLVEASFQQVDLLQQADPQVSLAQRQRGQLRQPHFHPRRPGQERTRAYCALSAGVRQGWPGSVPGSVRPQRQSGGRPAVAGRQVAGRRRRVEVARPPA
jgi:hypothetical protein